jgi:hypothetical protein
MIDTATGRQAEAAGETDSSPLLPSMTVLHLPTCVRATLVALTAAGLVHCAVHAAAAAGGP